MSPDRFGLYDYGRMPEATRRAVRAVCEAHAERLTKSGIGMVPCSAACASCVEKAESTSKGKKT